MFKRKNKTLVTGNMLENAEDHEPSNIEEVDKKPTKTANAIIDDEEVKYDSPIDIAIAAGNNKGKEGEALVDGKVGSEAFNKAVEGAEGNGGREGEESKQQQQQQEEKKEAETVVESDKGANNRVSPSPEDLSTESKNPSNISVLGKALMKRLTHGRKEDLSSSNNEEGNEGDNKEAETDHQTVNEGENERKKGDEGHHHEPTANEDSETPPLEDKKPDSITEEANNGTLDGKASSSFSSKFKARKDEMVHDSVNAIKNYYNHLFKSSFGRFAVNSAKFQNEWNNVWNPVISAFLESQKAARTVIETEEAACYQLILMEGKVTAKTRKRIAEESVSLEREHQKGAKAVENEQKSNFEVIVKLEKSDAKNILASVKR